MLGCGRARLGHPADYLLHTYHDRWAIAMIPVQGVKVMGNRWRVEANKIQTEMVTELRSGGDTIDRHARSNIKLTYIVILLTVSGLIMSAWPIIFGVSFTQNQQRTLEGYTSDISESMILTTKAVAESESQVVLREILSELKNLNGNLAINQEALSAMSHEIASLKSSNEEHKIKIGELHSDIEEFKSSNE